MKKILNSIGLIVFIGLIVSNMIMYKGCTNYKEKYKSELSDKEKLLTKFDSVLNLPPDTIELPAKIIKQDSIVYVTRWKNKPMDSELAIKTYKDSIINDSIDIRLKIQANELYSIVYNYKPIYKYQEKIIESKIPYPVTVVKEIEVPKGGLFFNVGLGYSEKDISAKLGLMLLTKKQSIYSYDLIRYDNTNIHMLSYGVKF